MKTKEKSFELLFRLHVYICILPSDGDDEGDGDDGNNGITQQKVKGKQKDIWDLKSRGIGVMLFKR